MRRILASACIVVTALFLTAVLTAAILQSIERNEQNDARRWHVLLHFDGGLVDWENARHLYSTDNGLAFTNERGGRVFIAGTYWVEPQDSESGELSWSDQADEQCLPHAEEK